MICRFTNVQDDILDESDVEWDNDIELRFGRRALHALQQPPPPMDVDFKPATIVEDIMTVVEALHEEAMVNLEVDREGGDNLNEEASGLYRSANSNVCGPANTVVEDPFDSGEEDDNYMTGEEEEDGEDCSDSEGGNNDECTDPLLSPVYEASKVPLFVGSLVSMLLATIIIMNCSRVHRVPSAHINELLHVLLHVILPQPNSLPNSKAAASSMLKKLGLGYEIIHCCANGCVWFRGLNCKANECPSYHKPRYRLHGKSKVPCKVLRHFPLIPRLKRMFATPVLSSLMTWHESNKSQDGKMRGPIDSPQWEHVTNNLSDFATEARSLRLGLCADGVNPFAQRRSTYSVWPICVFNYNMPLWLTTKKFFVMMTLLILGPESVTSDNIHVFLTPMVEELQTLWTVGVRCWDAFREVVFTLRAMILWCIGDYPAYAMMAGVTNKGYAACPICGPSTLARYSTSLRKLVYGGDHRRWLPMGHAWPSDIASFPKGVEVRGPPENMTGMKHLRWTAMRDEFLRNGGTASGKGDPSVASGVKRVPSLFLLPYWKVNIPTFIYICSLK